jgi:hypothetical protein
MCHASQTPFRRYRRARGRTNSARSMVSKSDPERSRCCRGACRRTSVHVFKTFQSFDGVVEDIILSARVVGELELGYNWAASILCVRNMEDCDAVPQRRFHFP